MRAITALDAPAAQLGESPLWHPTEQSLYWVDIPGRALHRHRAVDGTHQRWDFDSDLASIAVCRAGGLLLAQRDGLWHFDPHAEHPERRPIAAPPYDAGVERFNDGKTDPHGRFWVGTLYEPRHPALAALYRLDTPHTLRRIPSDITGPITVSNGLAWSPDAGTLYFSDTKAHTIYAHPFDARSGALGPQQVFARFAQKTPEQNRSTYGGRPDGAAVDAEGAYWVAMFEGQRLLRLSPEGQVLEELPLPVRCPTMPCFGGADLKTLYITTSREHRPAEELAAQPLAGRVLTCRVDVAGLPVNLFG